MTVLNQEDFARHVRNVRRDALRAAWRDWPTRFARQAKRWIGA